MAKQQKRKPEKKALVFQLGELSSLPNFVRVCREVAKCPARHLPVREYLRWTFIIVHDRWADALELPPHDPSLPKEADDDYIPGFASGLYDLLGPLAGWDTIVPPSDDEFYEYLSEDHVELSVAQVSEHLRARGFEVISAAQLRAMEPPDDYDSTSHVEAWLEEERAAFGPNMTPADRATLAFISGSAPFPDAPASDSLLRRCLAPNHHPARWNAYDLRIAEVLTRNGAAARLLPGLATRTWEAPEPGWMDCMVDRLVGFGMAPEAARELVVRHVVHDPSPGLSDALWLLVQRNQLRARYANDDAERNEVERALERALALARSTFGLKFPRDV